MNDYIACCGLDCGPCEARLATLRDDDALRAKVAAEWSELNHVEITPSMINCTGCRIPGAKTPYSGTLCPIRRCARARNHPTCAPCPDLPTCPKLAMVVSNNPAALRNLRS
jgi:hypothetical protein